MKRWIYALLIVPFLLVACDDDNNRLPDVTLSVEYANAVDVDGTVYVVKGEEASITRVTVTPVNTSHKAMISNVSYWFSGLFIGITPVYPFEVTLPTETLNPGSYELTMQMTVAEEKCSLATCVAQIPVVVVATAEDIPQSSTGDAPSTSANVDYVMR